MSEVSDLSPNRDPSKLTNFEFLHGLGYSFITPARNIKRHSEQRMTAFDSYDTLDPQQRSDRLIDISYYALELSTPLKPYRASHEALENIDPQNPETSQSLVDDLLIVLSVDEILSAAYTRAEAYSYPQIMEIKRLTADYTSDNTGALAALQRMTVPNRKLGYISATTARRCEVILRIAIAEEKGLLLPL